MGNRELMKKEVVVATKLTRDDYEELMRACTLCERPPSFVLRRALLQYLQIDIQQVAAG